MNQGLVQVNAADAEIECDHLGTEGRVWAARITECWRSSVEAIIRAGTLLIEAKAALPHGAFGAMLETELPFGERTAQRLMAIASDKRLSNPTHVSLLPASWGTLYELTKLTDDEFTSAVQQHVIRPDMLRGEAELIRPLTQRHTNPEPKIDAGEPPVYEAFSNAEADPVREAGLDGGSPAPMPNGARAIAPSRTEPTDSLDFFPTPPWATRALLEHVFPHLERRGHCKYQTAWEPACGKGHMAEPLKEYFGQVTATDIESYGYGEGQIDFLERSPARAFDWIITNPPFGDKTEPFVSRALDLAGSGVAMFVRLQWLEGVGRYERLYRDRPPTLISFFAERVPLHKGGWDPDGDTLTAYIWLVWLKGAEPRAPFWIPPGCRVALSKPEDVKKFRKAIVEGEAA